MSDRTGVTREARTLSGCDIGREVPVTEGEWHRIVRIEHYDQGVMIATDTYISGLYNLHRKPTDTVTVRGRDE